MPDYKRTEQFLFESQIMVIHLGRNPLICDCRLKWLNEYFHTHPVEKSGIACNMPRRLAKKSIGLIPNSRFRCSVNQNFDRTCDQFDKCPANCSCQGSIVDCRSQGLDHIPEDIPPSTTELHLQDNNLRVIKSNGAFKKLKNLQRLDLRNNKIYLIEENAFQGADQLSELFLNENFLSNISPNMFSGLQNLKTLLLRSNSLNFLTNNSFNNLNQLRLLSLYDNQISCIQRGAFDNLKSLSTLNLMSNPFVCNCGLKWLKDWLKHANIATGNPKCSAPGHLKDHSLVNLDDHSFECDLNHEQIDQCGNILVPLTAKYKASSCPVNCSCSDKIVRCSHQKLATVPQDIPLDVKELYLDSNQIEEIPEFFKKFLYLEKLDLSSNRIKEIPSRVFERLAQMDTLILSFNSIECINAESFAGLFKLRLLSLYANKMTTIPDGAFKDLKSLSHIVRTVHLFDFLNGKNGAIKYVALYCMHNELAYKYIKNQVIFNKAHRFDFQYCLHSPLKGLKF
ncbi:Slit 2 [Brachionus plicatilis]|uniref:Slit 2 n=1 Tax=Brachionus plicatilis TaxID=10195 RepID=A0A3M7SRV5_BRAPC|nr:Slit 2 [Brachionus plicatilis]